MQHSISIYTANPGELPIAVDNIMKDKKGKADIAGAWSAEFGPLNRFYCHRISKDAENWEAPFGGASSEQNESSSNFNIVSAERVMLRPVHWPNRKIDTKAFYDFRIYDIRPGHAEEYIEKLSAVLSVREKYSQNYAIWRPLSGNIHRIVHLWPYGSLDERTSVRNAVAKEPAWKEFVSQVFPILVKQRSSLLRPVAYEM
ncbi:MAG: NIPSNAP family protein [Rhodovibrionaceae bacterium]